jgi:hypothetical protein
MNLKGVKSVIYSFGYILKMANTIRVKPFSSSSSINRGSFNSFLEEVNPLQSPYNSVNSSYSLSKS